MKTVFISCSQKKDSALLLFFNPGVLFYLARMGRYVRRSAFSGKKYTRILVPSHLSCLPTSFSSSSRCLKEDCSGDGWRKKHT